MSEWRGGGMGAWPVESRGLMTSRLGRCWTVTISLRRCCCCWGCCVIWGEPQPGGKCTTVCFCEAFVICSRALFRCHTGYRGTDGGRGASAEQRHHTVSLLFHFGDPIDPAPFIPISRRQKEKRTLKSASESQHVGSGELQFKKWSVNIYIYRYIAYTVCVLQYPCLQCDTNTVNTTSHRHKMVGRAVKTVHHDLFC